MHATAEKPLWKPSASQIESANITAFRRNVEQRYCVDLPDYAALYHFSITRLEDFWAAVWDFTHVLSQQTSTTILANPNAMPGAQFFPDAKLNFAQNCLRDKHITAPNADAIVFWGENKSRYTISNAQLHASVAQMAAALRHHGVQPGDRVAAYMPNVPQTMIAALATAAIGAIWTSCSADFGAQGVLDRFQQVEPVILIVCDGYFGAGKSHHTLDTATLIAAGLPTVRQLICVPYLATIESRAPDLGSLPNAVTFGALLAPFTAAASIEIPYASLPFNHPLTILYSSGTTGVPKCIVHSAGGTLMMHLKEHQLHCDIKPNDRVLYFTTCGWMMWNWLLTTLASNATIVLYDGSPFMHRGAVLYDVVDAVQVTHLGISAKYIDALIKIHLNPMRTHSLSSLRMLLSTGSPLSPDGFDYVYNNIKTDLCLSSISGGTDIVACFVGGSPILPVYRGQIQCRLLGMAVDVLDDAGQPTRPRDGVHGTRGELVCTRPFPSMPIGFWRDADGSRYHAAYFERFANIWTHGDYCELTAQDGLVIYGRSDAVLNPGGVRIGTAEIYREVEKLPQVLESIAIGQDWPPDKLGDVRVVLFVKLAEGVVLDKLLIKKIKEQIKVNTSPRHVPERILQVPDIPRTRSGKIVELAVRNVVHGLPVKNKEALANAEALAFFSDREELQK